MASDLWYQLPPDMQTWNTAIMENLARKVPNAGQYVSGISWSSLDPSTGNGDGLIAMLNGLASAPVTIRGNRLAPIDILVTKSGNDVKFYPLSDLFLQKIYADNVIAQTQDDEGSSDEDYEGPATRVKNINTVNSVKYASIDAAKKLFDKLTKSASVANWMVDNMPETFLAVYNRAHEVETTKVASTNIPDLIVGYKSGDRYFVNCEEVTANDIGDFFKLANVSKYDMSRFMEGVPFVYDKREKVAMIHIPTEQDITSKDVDDAIFNDQNGVDIRDINDSYDVKNSGIYLTTAYCKTGDQVRGIVLNARCMEKSPNDDAFVDGMKRGPAAVPNQSDPSVDSHYDKYFCSLAGANCAARELFISDVGYAVQESVKSGVRTPLSVNMLKDLSEESTPAIGMVGLFLEREATVATSCIFGRIDNYESIGNNYRARVYNLFTHTPCLVDMRDYEFYEVNPERLSVMRNTDRADTVSMSGFVGRVIKTDEGDYIVDKEVVSEMNVPYALMSRYFATQADATKIASIAKENGSCVFEVLKVAAYDDNNNDKTKKDSKGTKSGTDDEKGAANQPQNPSSGSLAGQTAETAMSGGITTGGSFSPDINFFNEQAQGNSMMSQAQPGPVMANSPVSQNDLENVVSLNDSQVMDAYMMSDLVSNDMTSQETIQKASDSIVDALSRLSQLLFLVRQGGLGYLSEADLQVAMNKLNDVAQGLGIDPMRVGTM